jgi:hypothetical protein
MLRFQLQVLRDRGYRGLILWSQDSGDSLGAPPSSSEIIESYRSYPEQTNVLNHETKSFTVNEVSRVSDFALSLSHSLAVGLSSLWKRLLGENGENDALFTSFT